MGAAIVTAGNEHRTGISDSLESFRRGCLACHTRWIICGSNDHKKVVHKGDAGFAETFANKSLFLGFGVHQEDIRISRPPLLNCGTRAGGGNLKRVPGILFEHWLQVSHQT